MSASQQSRRDTLKDVLNAAFRRIAISIDFKPCATVMMVGTHQLNQAMAYARSGALRSRWRRRIDAAADRIEWDFENEEDAILFLLKFGRGAKSWKPEQDKYRVGSMT